MENATKALFIASGVMIGIMILSLGVYLYTNLGSYAEEVQQQMEINANNKFNTQYLKYINMTEDSTGTYTLDSKKYKMDFKISIQDIITVVNLAYENNREHGLQDGQTADANENNLYVKVTAPIRKADGTMEEINFLSLDYKTQSISSRSAEWLSNDNGYIYKCRNIDVKISDKTGRVYEINFK